MPLFHDAFPDLVRELEREARDGVREPQLDLLVNAARSHWKALSPEQQIDARPMAEALGALTKARPGGPATAGAAGAGSYAKAGSNGGSYVSEASGSNGAGASSGGGPSRSASAVGTSVPGVGYEPHFYEGPPDPDLLLAHIGLAGFRPGQREAVTAALEGRDSLVVMPTGGGKSLCYQLPGLASSRLTVVVSPLVALMSDQLRRLTEDGHPAVMIASGMTEEDNRASFDALRSGLARIVFCSPERFASSWFVSVLEQRGVDLFVIDEAHCLAEWGHDFRPDYLRLPVAIERLGRPTVMAATATATEAVAGEIIDRLGLRDPEMVRSGFDRPNLSFDVAGFEGKGTKDGKRALLLGALTDPELKPAIIYCGTRKDCEEVAGMLRDDGHEAAHYHAGLPSDRRAGVQRAFMDGSLDIIVATNAFGMGVDKADVRFVCHWAMPTSVEAYYQEAGRGGRDGAPSRALLLASRADLSRLIHFNTQRAIEPETVASYHRRLLSRAQDGVLEMERPENDDDRTSLAIVERAGGARLAPAASGRLHVTVERRLDPRTVDQICREAKDRGWRAYRAIEAYAFGDTCRRRTLLDHFGDRTEGAPIGRCCDVHDPDLGFNPPKALKKRKSSGSGGGAQEPSPNNPAPEVYAALVVWRREAAADKPAYTVATNRTLEAIADVRPTNELELGAIKGVGPAFLEKFADDVLEIVG
ncbi:MAG: RecQ family ATP-dependent DNA helicase [Solirubrobacteraceae bacterium]|nr:RecQ family ATP-dependent DNA helicase [Solirubrobacteraceae bacterium]